MPVSQQSGFTFPMIADGPQGHVNYVHNNSQELVADSVLQILLTNPGERMWNPQFGCRVRQLQFELGSEADATLIKSLIIEAITLWEPRVSVTANDIVVTYANDNSGKTNVTVSYTILNPDFTGSPTGTVTIIL